MNCVKSVRIRSNFGPHFPAFKLNTKRYSVFLHIQSECWKIWTRITPNTDNFYAMIISMLPLFECITHSPAVSLEEIKLITIFNWIFYMSNLLRSFMIFFKCGLISSRYSWISTILFFSPLLSYSIKNNNTNYLLLLVCENLIIIQEDF